jgi:hypothetical protein
LNFEDDNLLGSWIGGGGKKPVQIVENLRESLIVADTPEKRGNNKTMEGMYGGFLEQLDKHADGNRVHIEHDEIALKDIDREIANLSQQRLGVGLLMEQIGRSAVNRSRKLEDKNDSPKTYNDSYGEEPEFTWEDSQTFKVQNEIGDFLSKINQKEKELHDLRMSVKNDIGERKSAHQMMQHFRNSLKTGVLGNSKLLGSHISPSLSKVDFPAQTNEMQLGSGIYSKQDSYSIEKPGTHWTDENYNLLQSEHHGNSKVLVTFGLDTMRSQLSQVYNSNVFDQSEDNVGSVRKDPPQVDTDVSLFFKTKKGGIPSV